MVFGYSIIAVPTGIVTAEIFELAVSARKVSAHCCPRCVSEGHNVDASYCRVCSVSPEQTAAES
jgi:voltage-gated potassium channel